MNQQIQKRQASALDRVKVALAPHGARARTARAPLSAAQPKSGGAWVGAVEFRVLTR